jgi:hypothetical protein
MTELRFDGRVAIVTGAAPPGHASSVTIAA